MKHLLIALLTLVSVSVFAMDLDSARAAKKVVELPSGYIEAKDPSAKSLEKEINDKRRKAYEEIAKKNGLTVDQVAEQAAKKIAEKKGK